MIYANRITKEMYVFDKDGEWHDEGVYHESLSLDKTYNETNWYDEFSVHNFWVWSLKLFKLISIIA